MDSKAPKEGPLIVFSAGDLSGDMHAAHLVARLREEWGKRHPDEPPLRFVAAGADHLRSAGVEIWEDTTLWGVMGVFEGLKILPRLVAAKSRLVRRIRAERPALVVTVDYRSLNI
jgi:lipid A disaccharide synthetase